MHSFFHRYLNSKNYGHNIEDSKVFRHSREVLEAKMKELKALRKGNHTKASEPFTEKELDTDTRYCFQNLLGTGTY